MSINIDDVKEDTGPELSKEQVEAKGKFEQWWEKVQQSYFESDQEGKPLFESYEHGDDWRKRRRRLLNSVCPEPFRIFGYAGTGKTFLTKRLLKKVLGITLFGGYTGKSCLVMMRNGMPAKTIHSRIYKMVPPSKEDADRIKKEMEVEIDPGKKLELKKQLANASTMHFELNEYADLRDAELYVLDEVSFLNHEIRKDIESFGVPLLVLGDPGQLPPIDGTGAFVSGQPDAMLTEIHRQALDNPIIVFSMKARMGVPFTPGDYGKVKIKGRKSVDADELLKADQILAGKNDTRRKINTTLRRIKGYEPDSGDHRYPMVGEKIICLRNNRPKGLFNGLTCTVLERLNDYDRYIEYKVMSEDDREMVVKAHRAHFDEYAMPGTLKELKWWDFQDTDEFDFGYAITVHKSQGSQYNKVVLVDDGFFQWDKPMRKRWLYTGTTRAVDELTVLQ